MFDYIAAFMVGLIGSVHCLGMCGPLIVAYSLQVRDPLASGAASSCVKQGISHHVAFHSGRIFSYGVLGALGAALFGMAGMNTFVSHLRGGVVLIAALLLIYFGGVVLKLLPLPRFLSNASISNRSFPGEAIGRLLRSRDSGSRVAIGLVAGFLPCGLSWAAIVKAASTGNIADGFLTMVAFGLGTVPVLFMTGVSGSFLSIKIRIIGERLAGISIIAMGLILLFKGVRVLA